MRSEKSKQEEAANEKTFYRVNTLFKWICAQMKKYNKK